MALPKTLTKIKPATAFPFILGVFTGTLLTTFLVLALRSMDESQSPLTHEHSTKPPQTPTPPEIQVSRPKITSQNLPSLSPISYNVLTTSDHLQSRVVPIHRTWGGRLADIQYYLRQPGGEREINFAAKKRIPLVSLEGSDIKVGQSELFRIWMDICEQKSSLYNWFMKVEDNVYVNTNELEKLLASLNSSEPLLLGRLVYLSEEGEAGLSDTGESYCDESGYIVSWGAVQRLCPVLPWCWENALSDNEEVELARCIRMSGNVNCTTSSEMEELFYNAADEIDEEQLQLGEHNLNPSIQRALLVSPLKEPDHFYHYHLYQTGKIMGHSKQTMKELRAQLLLITELSAQSKPLYLQHHSSSWTKLGVNLPYRPQTVDEGLTHFQMLDDKYKYTESLHYPIHTLNPDEEAMVAKTKSAVSKALENVSGKLRFDDFIQRFDPQRGIDVFSLVFDENAHQSLLVHSLRAVEPPRVISAQISGYKTTKVNFVVAAPAVSRGFQRFMISFESSFLARNPPELVGLLVVLYSDDGLFKRFDEDLQAVTSLVRLYKGKYPKADLRFVSSQKSQSRTETLNIASNEFPSYELLFLADIHIDFSTKFLERCRMIAIENKQVYFPAIFNPYHPNKFYKARILYPHSTKFPISADRGNWMHESYHIACVYNSDLAYALELHSEYSDSLTLVEMFLQLSKLNVFRSVEPGLVHLWQDGCKDEHMGESEQALCETLDSVLYSS